MKNNNEELLSILRNLALDRKAVKLMRENIAAIEKDLKQSGLPASQREALEGERRTLSASLAVTSGHILRVERLLSLLTPEERQVLNRTVINPRPRAVLDLAEEIHCETTRVYRTRAKALRKLARLRYGAASFQ